MLDNRATGKTGSRTATEVFTVLVGIVLLLSLSLFGCSQAQNGAGAGAGNGGQSGEQGSAQSAQGTAAGKADYVTISAEEAKKIMDANSEAIILDVRTQQEFDQGHIPGAICIPVETIGSEPPSELADKDATILVYCRSGNRSKQAAEKLVALGYTDIREFGGINSWPYETTK